MDMLDVCDMQFEADIAGAAEEARVSAKVITSVVSAAAKIVTDLF